MFVWHVLQNRIPTKVNLCKTVILSDEAQLFIGGYGIVKPVQHLLSVRFSLGFGRR